MKSILLVALAVCAPVIADEPQAATTNQKAASATDKKAESTENKKAESTNSVAKKAETTAKSDAKPAKSDAESAKKAAAATKSSTTKSAATPAKNAAAAKPAEKPLHELPTMKAMLKRNNELRQSVGLNAQKISPRLTKAAQQHAAYMARTGAFDHYVNGSPLSRARGANFNGGVSENIAMGQGSVDAAFRAWRYSSGHWANIRSSHREVGFGYAKSAGGRPYWVTMYGTPRQPKTEGADPSSTSTQSYTTSSRRSSTGPLRKFAKALLGRR